MVRRQISVRNILKIAGSIPASLFLFLPFPIYYPFSLSLKDGGNSFLDIANSQSLFPHLHRLTREGFDLTIIGVLAVYFNPFKAMCLPNQFELAHFIFASHFYIFRTSKHTWHTWSQIAESSSQDTQQDSRFLERYACHHPKAFHSYLFGSILIFLCL